LASIAHRGGERVNTIRGFLTAGVLPASVLEQLQARLQAAPLALPPGYRYEIGGEAAQRDTAVDHLLASVGVLLVLMATTLVLTCQSFRIAGIMASIAGLSVGLALASLWVFGYPFGFTAIVGTTGYRHCRWRQRGHAPRGVLCTSRVSLAHVSLCHTNRAADRGESPGVCVKIVGWDLVHASRKRAWIPSTGWCCQSLT
jgi:hypothetical protein